MSDRPNVLDAAVVAELRRLAAESGSEDFLSQLVRIFLSNAPVRMAVIRDAIARKERNMLETAAHTLRSNCAMLGALRMADYCRQFELLAQDRDYTAAWALVTKAEDEFALVVEEVENLISTP